MEWNVSEKLTEEKREMNGEWAKDKEKNHALPCVFHFVLSSIQLQTVRPVKDSCVVHASFHYIINEQQHNNTLDWNILHLYMTPIYDTTLTPITDTVYKVNPIYDTTYIRD